MVNSNINLFNIKPSGPIRKTAGQRRVLYGYIVERLCNKALGSQQLKIDGRKEHCMDGQIDDLYIEVKSVRYKNKSPVYDFRVDKDVKSGKKILYAFFIHRCYKEETYEDLYNSLITKTIGIFLHDLDSVQRLCEATPLSKIKNCGCNGYSRTGYKDGYRNIKCSNIMSGSRLVRWSCFEHESLGFRIPIYEC